RSCTSGFRLVNPQAMRWLWPTTMKGNPGRENPSISKSPEWSCSSYHTPGTWCGKCISFESSGLPETVCAPETTQLFEPGKQDSQKSICGSGTPPGKSWLVFLRIFGDGFCIERFFSPFIPASLAGGWSRGESSG